MHPSGLYGGGVKKQEALFEYRRIQRIFEESGRCAEIDFDPESKNKVPYPSPAYPVRSRLLCDGAYAVGLSVYGGHPDNLKTETFDFQFIIRPPTEQQRQLLRFGTTG